MAARLTYSVLLVHLRKTRWQVIQCMLPVSAILTAAETLTTSTHRLNKTSNVTTYYKYLRDKKCNFLKYINQSTNTVYINNMQYNCWY